MRRFYELSIQILSVLAILGIILGVYYYLSTLPPPPTTPYNIAKLYNMSKDYEEALKILRPEIKKHPDDKELLLLYGKTLLKNNQRQEAAYFYAQLIQKYPDSEEVQLGLAEASIASDSYESAIPLYERLVEANPRNASFKLMLADVYFQAGKNLKAAEVYRYLIENDQEKEEAQKRLLALYGVPTYRNDMDIGINQKYIRPSSLRMNFRTNGDFFEAKDLEQWRRVFWKGVNLTAASPGHWVSNPPADFETYSTWLQMMVDMNCNVVRLYTLCSPAFYQALKAHNEQNEKKIWLFQEVWLHVRDPFFHIEQEAFNLYDPSLTKDFKNEITEIVDVLHGRADVPKRKGRIAGIYTADVSDYVCGIGLGKEVETYIAAETNEKNPDKTNYSGQYISLPYGNPTECWFAEMCDFCVGYEMSKYNSQHPLTVVNAPQFDTLRHPSEATFEEQHRWEKIYGLPEFPFSRIDFENDLVELDITKYTTSSEYKAGLFACFHNYPHWPDFIWADAKYAEAEDQYGPNPFFGYLKELKEAHPNFPLLLGEYGVSTSWYPVYNTIHSIDQGGYNYEEQSDLVIRFTKNAFDLKYAGALVFEWQDEWWHTSVNLNNFMNTDLKPFWFNVLDGEANYGIESYIAEPPIPLLRGEKSDWKKAVSISSDSIFNILEKGQIKKVYAYSDFAFLYLRMDIKLWENGTWPEDIEYLIALSTYPGKFGAKIIPVTDLKIEDGINFLIHLRSNHKATIQIAKNYNPHEWMEMPAILGGKTLWRKQGLPQKLVEYAPFENIYLPTQTYHIGRDGTIFPALYSNWSPLQYGSADNLSPEFNSHAAWHVDEKKGMIEIRIPWLSMFVIDPPTHSVLADLLPGGHDFGSPIIETPGIGILAITRSTSKDKNVFQTLPRAKRGILKKGTLPLYSWRAWGDIVPPYNILIKPIFYALQKEFNNLNFEVDSEGSAQQNLRFSSEANDQGSFAKNKRDAIQVHETGREKPKTQINLKDETHHAL
jgi:tetratricopeptide (TPR) repeat protein